MSDFLWSDPVGIARQAPLSMGFSRQEYWSESEVAQSCPTLCDPMDCRPQAPLSMELCRQEYWSGLLFPPPGNLPNPGIEPRSPAFQTYSLPSEPPGKAFPTYKNEKKEIFRGKTYSTPVVY